MCVAFYMEGDYRHTIPLIKMVTENIKDNTCLEFRFSEYIQNRIQNLKGFFTQYDIKNISMFTSRYAFMLYEFFKMKLQQGNGVYHQKISVEDFKINLDISDKYSIFRNLKIKVIDIAKAQINDYSDIKLDYVVIKTGRTPTHIKFTAKFKQSHKAKAIDVEKENQKGRVDASEKGFTEEHKATAKKHISKLKEKLRN
jgi:plasmid replication initiation protein